MSFRLDFRRLFSAIGVSALLLSSTPAISAQRTAFTGLGGAWSGGGTVSLSDGSTERIRCRANYSLGGGGTILKRPSVAQATATISISSAMSSFKAAAFQGTWNESSRNINGTLQGRASGDRITVFVEAAGFAANLILTTHGDRQSISINSQGAIKNVSLALVRG